ncbi:MAG: Maf family protein [Desulforhabdus sp.]|jgi:septum formation protein|nr:Maf family protein [Desulforhabdus sp.]
MVTSAKYVFRTIEPIILASVSPRRKELLHSMGLVFEIVPSNSDESRSCGASPNAAALNWSREKAGLVADLYPNKWVLAADTIVVQEDQILGKPRDPQDARTMLGRLSGKMHKVITGICLIRNDRRFERTEAVETQVRFKHLTEREIEAYVLTGEPLDKAGAYGIQGMGAFMVESVDGSYTNVVGLPLCKTLSWLLELGVIEPRASE